MNIQFMTNEKNGIPTGRTNWKGEKEYKYVPNFAEMIENATCNEERAAIYEAETFYKDFGFTFAYEIVYTAKTKTYDFDKGERVEHWEVYQTPWYSDRTKSEMLEEIEKHVEEMQSEF